MILHLDKDPETMTTIPTPTPEPLTRTTPDGVVVEALHGPAMKALLRRLHAHPVAKNTYCKARGTDGTDTIGLYLELVCTTPGKESHSRYFVVGEHVYLSHREKGSVKANWRYKKAASLEAALQFIDRTMARENVFLYGRVLLVELEADSISQIETAQLPSARFRGQYRIERDFGKYEWDKPIVSEPLPPSAVKMLQEATAKSALTTPAA